MCWHILQTTTFNWCASFARKHSAQSMTLFQISHSTKSVQLDANHQRAGGTKPTFRYDTKYSSIRNLYLSTAREYKNVFKFYQRIISLVNHWHELLPNTPWKVFFQNFCWFSCLYFGLSFAHQNQKAHLEFSHVVTRISQQKTFSSFINFDNFELWTNAVKNRCFEAHSLTVIAFITKPFTRNNSISGNPRPRCLPS